MRELLSDFRIRRLLLAYTASSLGASVTITAVPWLLVQRPGGDQLYGYLTIAMMIAVMVLIPSYGSWLDRHSRKLALQIGESLAAIITVSMALWIALTGHVATWQLLVLYSSLLLYNTLYFPTKFAFLQQVFDKRHYHKLTGLMEIQVQTASLMAGAIISVMLDRVPIHLILFGASVTYLFSLVIQTTIPYRATHLTTSGPREKTASSLIEGIRWMRDRPKFTLFLVCTLTPYIAAMTGWYLFPIYVQDILHAPAAVFGRGEMAFAFGAILIGIIIPRLTDRYSAANLILVMIGLCICGLVLLGLLHYIFIFYVAFILLGLSDAGSRIARTTILLAEVPHSIMGRINVTISAMESLLRTILQFGTILVVVRTDANWGFIGLALFVGLALWGAYYSRHSLHPSSPQNS